MKSDVRLSKFLSLVLRHRPSAAGIELDAAGWAWVEELLEGARRKGLEIDEATLHRIVRTSDKQRYALTPDGRRIRANQGHSVPIDLGLEAVEPPDELFHGTAASALESIGQRGLLPMRRQHVHLSEDIETARRVGGRHGPPTVLRIDAAGMREAGHVFFRSENGVWLVGAVPPGFLSAGESGAAP